MRRYEIVSVWVQPLWDKLFLDVWVPEILHFIVCSSWEMLSYLCPSVYPNKILLKFTPNQKEKEKEMMSCFKIMLFLNFFYYLTYFEVQFIQITLLSKGKCCCTQTDSGSFALTPKKIELVTWSHEFCYFGACVQNCVNYNV